MAAAAADYDSEKMPAINVCPYNDLSFQRQASQLGEILCYVSSFAHTICSKNRTGWLGEKEEKRTTLSSSSRGWIA